MDAAFNYEQSHQKVAISGCGRRTVFQLNSLVSMSEHPHCHLVLNLKMKAILFKWASVLASFRYY